MLLLQLDEKRKKAKSEGRSTIEEDDPDKASQRLLGPLYCAVQDLSLFTVVVSATVAQSNYKDVCRHRD